MCTKWCLKTSKSTFLTKFDDFDNFRQNYWPLLFDLFWKKIGKNNSKKWLNFFLKKSWQLQIFKNTPRPAETSADPQIWGVVTFGPRKSSETRGCVFYPVLGSEGFLMWKSTKYLSPKMLSEAEISDHGGFWGSGRNFWPKK